MESYVNLVTNCLNNYATIGDIVSYNIICTNESNIAFSNVFISNNLNPNLKFIKDSIKINSIEKPGLDILSGFSIGKLGASRKTSISFDVEILSKDDDSVSIISSAECVYKEENIEKTVIVNKSSLIYIFEPNVYISKSVNKSKVSLNDTVTYTIKLVNNGDLNLEKIVLKDNISKSLKIVDGSFTVNSSVLNGIDFEKGINIGSLEIDDSIIIQYDAVIVGKGISCKITNEVFATYTYSLDNGVVGFKATDTVSCDLDIALPSFKQVSIEEYINLAPHKADITSIEHINTEVIIKHYHSIKTPIATSNEGTYLSGYKLIVHGKISQIIRYTAKTTNNPVHSLEYEMPFSTFIILPSDYSIGNKVQIDSKIEYTHYNLINPRCIFENLNVLLIARTFG